MKGSSGPRRPQSTWDPEKGQVWVDTFSSEQTSSSQHEEVLTHQQFISKINIKDKTSEITQKQNIVLDLLDNSTAEKTRIVPANSDDYHDLD